MDELGEFVKGKPGELIEFGEQISISFWYKIENPDIHFQIFF